MATAILSDVAVGMTVRDDIVLTSQERDALGNKSTLDNFAHFAKHSTPQTQLFFSKVYRGPEFIGLATVTKLVRHKGTELLRPGWRRWMGPLLGPLSRTTTYMVDSAFTAFETIDPFLCVDPAAALAVRSAIADHLQGKKDADTVWLSEPRRDTGWAEARGYDCLSILPMVCVDVSGHTTVDGYLAGLSKKRRANWRADRRLFAHGGGRLVHHEHPIPAPILEQMYECLLRSAARNDLCVPFGDLMNDRAAFMTQDQHAIVAIVEGRVVGFFSFIANGETMQQCHGGVDYGVSLSVKAYANLINAAIAHAITRRFSRLTMGPLNNETKRRAGSHIVPFMASIWCRDPIGRFLSRRLFLRNFQVYRGEVDAESEAGTAG